MDFDLTNLDDVKALFSLTVDDPQQQQRKKHSLKAYEILDGQQKKYTQHRLSELFPQSHSKMTASDKSILYKVVDKVSKAYKEPPKRALENEVESKSYEELLSKNMFNEAMSKVDIIFNKDRYAALWILKSEDPERSDAYDFRPMDGHSFDAYIHPDTGKLVALILSYKHKNFTDFAVWTNEQHVKLRRFSQTGDLMRVPVDPKGQNNTGVNELGVIPFAFIKKGLGHNFPLPNKLVDQSTDFNVLWSQLLSAACIQGFGQMVRKIVGEAQVKTISTGLTTAIDLVLSEDPNAPQPDVSYINPNPDLEGQQKVFLTDLRMTLSEYGINTKEAITGDVQEFSSGLDRMIAQADVQDVVEKNQGYYWNFENQVYQIIRAYEETRGGVTLSETPLQIVFKKPKVLSSDKDTRDIIKLDLELGLIEEWEKFQRLDPNLTEKQCRDKLKAIQDEQLLKRALFRDFPPKAPVPSEAPLNQTNEEVGNNDQNPETASA